MPAMAATPAVTVLHDGFAQALHGDSGALDLRDRGIDRVTIFGEMRPPLRRQPIELASALRCDGGIARFLQIGQRGINNAGTWHVEAVREVIERLDDLVAVTWLLLDEREDDEL